MTVTSGVERKVDRLGRIVIPAEIRDRFGIHDGTSMDMSVHDGTIVLSPLVHVCSECGRPTAAAG